MTRRRAAVGAGEAASSVVVDGVRIAYDEQGRGPVLLCLHAAGHGARDFAALRARLAGRCRVLALDWPGHGRSAGDHEVAGAERYAELLDGFVAALALRDVVLLGNSVGGAAALRFAARRSELVRGLVLVDSAGLDRVDALVRGVTRLMAAFFAAGARGARWFPRTFGLYYRMVLTEEPALAQRARIVASGREIAPRLAEAWRSFGAPSADLRDVAAALSCPVLVCWATRDRVLQLRRSLPAIRRIPHARLETFPGGHAPFLECPEAFCRTLEEFLASLGAPRDAGDGQPASSAERDDALEGRLVERHDAQS